METTSLLEAFELADLSGRRALLQSEPPPEGFSEQFFHRVAKLLGENPVAAQRLAEGWVVVHKFGDDPSFALRAKGALERMQGNWLSSARAFILSGTLASKPTDQVSFQTGAIDSLARAGKTDRAVKLGKSIASTLESLGEKGLAGRAWLNTGNAYNCADRHKNAQMCFNRAVACLEGTSFKLESASARLGASTSALYIDLPSRSMAMTIEARDEMNAIGALAYGNHAQVNVGQCYLMMGKADESVRIFSELRSLVGEDTLEYARLGQFLGDAWLVLQVYEAADDAFRSALISAGIRQSPLNRGNCLVGLGDVRLHQGKAEEAKALYAQASRLYTKYGNHALNNLARIGIARANLALGRIKTAIALLRETVRDLRGRRMFHFQVSAMLDLASITNENEPLLKEAQMIIRKFGFMSEAWRIHAIRAEAEGSTIAATKEYRKMVNAILTYRARLSSITARTTLIEPCMVSIRKYLDLLINRGTAASIREAIQVISNLRSITLLDEILMTETATLSESAQLTLSRIRQEVTAEGGNQLPGGPLRLVGKGAWSRPTLVREYLEQVGMDRLNPELLDNGQPSDRVVNTFVFLPNQSAWISGSKCHKTLLTKTELIKRLRWIHFELMAPLAGFDSDEDRLHREMSRLRDDLGVEHLETRDNLVHVSPEDVAYQIPWSLLSPHEAVLHLRPSTGSMPNQCTLGPDPKIGIWYFSRKDLPHIDNEVEQLRTLFPQAKVYSTVKEILESAEQESFDLIHVAAHGRYDHENPMFSSIQMADGHLLACDIARSAFKTRIATLASCDSASMGHPTGWEPQGLARAFLARNSEVVIASLWPLNDQAAEFVFAAFYRNLKEGFSVSTSLSEARAELRARFTHPAYWGSLVMFGGYSSPDSTGNKSTML